MMPSNYLIGLMIKYMHFTPKFHCFSVPCFVIFLWLIFCVTCQQRTSAVLF